MNLKVLYKSTIESGYGYYNEFIIKEQGIILHNIYATKTLQLKGLDCIIQNESGTMHKELTLKDRVLKYDCGNVVDRDLNASLNIRDYK